MRIIITKKGSVIFKEFNDNKILNNSMNDNSNFYKRYYSMGHCPKIKNIIINNKSHNIKYEKSANNFQFITPSRKNSINNLENNSLFTLRKSSLNTSFDISENKINLIKNKKFIKLHKPKFKVPKKFSDKYENDLKENSSVIIDSNINYCMPSINLKNSNNSSLSEKKLYSFNDIIPKENIIEMKKKVIYDYMEKEKYSKVTDNNFRSIYRAESNLDRFNFLLFSPKIESTKLSLIKYLNEKKINPKSLISLYRKNPIKINKINQMCINYFINKGNKSFNDLLGNKIKDKKEAIRNSLKKIIKDAEKKVDFFKEKLERYNHKIDEKEKYKELLIDIKRKYWDRYNLDRFKKNFDSSSKNIYSFSGKSMDNINNNI